MKFDFIPIAGHCYKIPPLLSLNMFRFRNYKQIILLLGIVVLVLDIFYCIDIMRNNIFKDEKIAHIMEKAGVSLEDYWITRNAFLTRESVLKLHENYCKPPILNPFAPSMMIFFTPVNISVNCSTRPFYFKSLVEEDDSINLTPQYTILQYREKPRELKCCYEQLSFAKQEGYKPNKKSPCIFFTKNKTVVPSHTQYLIIKCWNATVKQIMRGKTQISKKELLTSVPEHRELLFYVPAPTRELLYLKKRQMIVDDKEEKPLNVIIIGFDQVSRANFIRLMGKTFKYLRSELDALDLQGFNKMGDATLNNTLALLTGHDFGEIRAKQWFSTRQRYFDNCPWIWKKFSKKGYITAYADDSISVFDYRFNGFKTQPTDYYMQPFMNWYYYAKKRQDSFGSSDCIGDEPTLHLISDHAKKMSAALKSHPYFHFMWGSRIHERPGYPALADNNTLETLKYFESTGVLNQSLVVLLSDHGWRAGPIMLNSQARLENRLSFAFLLLPQWFREKYPLAYENLQENQYRLTSPYDIHATLEDMLDPAGQLSENVLHRRKSFPGTKGVSLFLPISRDRSCADAGIDEEWCACTKYQSFSVDSLMVQQLAQYAVSTLNSWVRPFPRCHQYVLQQVISAEVNRSHDQNPTSRESVYLRENQQFRISFSVTPGDARFEVTIFTKGEYWQSSNSKFISMSAEVFRLNYYDSAFCMPVYSLKKICSCKWNF